MLTASEILFIKDLVQHLADVSDLSDYTSKEIDLALELLNRLEPVDTDKFIDFMDQYEEEEEVEA